MGTRSLVARHAATAATSVHVKGTVSAQGQSVQAGTRTVAGHKVVAISGFGADGTSTLLIANSGTPYPVQLVSTTGTLTFSQWNVPVTVTKPTDVVSLASLTG